MPRDGRPEAERLDDDSRIGARHSRPAERLQVHDPLPRSLRAVPRHRAGARRRRPPGHLVRCHSESPTIRLRPPALQRAGMRCSKLQDLHVRFPTSAVCSLAEEGGGPRRRGRVASTQQGETLGLVGESGCGKTTVGRAIVNILRAMSYSVEIYGGKSCINARWRREPAPLKAAGCDRIAPTSR